MDHHLVLLYIRVLVMVCSQLIRVRNWSAVQRLGQPVVKGAAHSALMVRVLVLIVVLTLLKLCLETLLIDRHALVIRSRLRVD